MENANKFRGRMRRGQICLGTSITFTDPTVTEALCSVLDFVWIDMEHSALSLETVQAHIMATKGSDTTPLVRVPWNDPVLIKPVLDIGAAGVIVPLIRTADDAHRAVAACRYPPDGIRGFGPRRPSNYGRVGGPAFCQAANDTIITIVQIEHIDAVNHLDEILAVPGLTGIVVGSNDLAGSMGQMGEPRHPDVRHAIETVIAKARRTEVFVGIAIGDDPDTLIEWVDKGMQWLVMGTDFTLLLRAADQIAGQVREQVCRARSSGEGHNDRRSIVV
jgi:2-dehydro-3-deoxyglucarate aldolase/4-hydroxy-2-oxoheptanedioate aldolase